MNTYPVLQIARLYRMIYQYIRSVDYEVPSEEIHNEFVMSGRFGQDTYIYAMNRITNDAENLKYLMKEVTFYD